ncbi:MAG: hypothetical protein JSU07_08410 [Bacteroidetes bacterium]|nr:hypothetical protein [Bacteroidota bacterium]
MMRKIVLIFSLLGVFSIQKIYAQDGIYTSKKERKRMWRRAHRSKGPSNPYIDAKAKDKPSARLSRGDKRELRKQKREARRQLRKSKHKLHTQ